MGQRTLANGEATSALRFDSDDPKSLIRTGSGYWHYVPSAGGIRVFTWYDYRVRFGIAGKLVDRVAFRPLMGWATAWSFDRMRLWVEDGQTPETSVQLFLIHGTARIAIAAIWLWHGLIPKLLYNNFDERSMLSDANIPDTFLPYIGGCEVLLGILFLYCWKLRPMFLLNIVLMLGATIAVASKSPRFLCAAFNPVSLNAAPGAVLCFRNMDEMSRSQSRIMLMSTRSVVRQSVGFAPLRPAKYDVSMPTWSMIEAGM